jgi:DNA-binding CsgD family transcriptional regulator
MKICDFVEWELEYFRQQCNFTDDERRYFEYKAKNKSNVQIAQLMCVSENTVVNIGRKVKRKMLKVL